MYDHGGMWRTEVRAGGNDTAYQAIPLPAHTDGTYFQDAPGLQVFHCIQNDEGGGGASLLVDGFTVAAALATLSPAAYSFFSSTPLPFRFLDTEHSYSAWHRVFETDAAGRLVSFNFNNDDRAPLVPPHGAPASLVQDFYEHLPALLQCIRSERAELWFQLTPGLVLVFDNRRLLHGRSGFSVSSSRVLSGCYINEEEWRSKLQVLQAEHTGENRL
jgi:trimethyllysine dioxygenase